MSGKSIKVGAAILAAGKASRFQAPKMLLPVFGKPLLLHLLDICEIFADTVVISGFWHQAIEESLSTAKTSLLFNAKYEKGLSSSLLLAMRHAEQKKWDGLAIVLGDTLVKQSHLAKLLAHFMASRQIVATKKENLWQPPVIFPAFCYPFFSGLSGDRGLGKWLRSRKDVQILPAEESMMDFDRWEDYLAFYAAENSCFPPQASL